MLTSTILKTLFALLNFSATLAAQTDVKAWWDPHAFDSYGVRHGAIDMAECPCGCIVDGATLTLQKKALDSAEQERQLVAFLTEAHDRAKSSRHYDSNRDLYFLMHHNFAKLAPFDISNEFRGHILGPAFTELRARFDPNRRPRPPALVLPSDEESYRYDDEAIRQAVNRAFTTERAKANWGSFLNERKQQEREQEVLNNILHELIPDSTELAPGMLAPAVNNGRSNEGIVACSRPYPTTSNYITNNIFLPRTHLSSSMTH